MHCNGMQLVNQNRNFINSANETKNPKNKLLEGLDNMMKSVNNVKNFCGEDYSEVVDISKVGKLQRALKWAGLKQVS